jgi:hypothetical protein
MPRQKNGWVGSDPVQKEKRKEKKYFWVDANLVF